MSTLNVQDFSTVGIAPAFTAADAAGNTFKNAGNTYLFVDNASAASITATVNAVAPCNYGFDHDLAVTIPAGTTQKIGPFDYGRYNDANGNVGVTYSAAASVTVAALRV